MLRSTLESLVSPAERPGQGGYRSGPRWRENQAVQQVAQSFGVHLKQNKGACGTVPARARARSLTPTICDRRFLKRAGHAGLRGAVNDGATRIAANYKFALSYVFSVRPQVRRPPSLLRAVLISVAFGRLPQSLSSRMTSSFRRTSLNISSTTRALVRSCFAKLCRHECVRVCSRDRSAPAGTGPDTVYHFGME